MKTLALAMITCFALSTPAFAQGKDDEPSSADEPAGDEVEMGADDTPAAPLDDEGTPSGAEENPSAPTLGKILAKPAPAAAAPAGPTSELVHRELTLPAAQLQISYAAGFGGLSEKIAYWSGVVSSVDNQKLVRLGGVLSAEYGITNETQIGLHYGTGTLGEINDNGAAYETGKTVAVEVRYKLAHWVAAQFEVPINVQPVAAALTIGAPMKFGINDKVALYVFEDLFTVKLAKFVPVTEDAVSNAASEEARKTNTELPNGDITVKGGVIYQISNKLAFKGTLGVVAQDFSLDKDPGVPLLGELFYAMSDKIDVYGNAGFFNLADTDFTVHIGGGIALRI